MIYICTKTFTNEKKGYKQGAEIDRDTYNSLPYEDKKNFIQKGEKYIDGHSIISLGAIFNDSGIHPDY